MDDDWRSDSRGTKGKLNERWYTREVEAWYRDYGARFGGHWATVAAYRAADEQPTLWQAAIELYDRKCGDDDMKPVNQSHARALHVAFLASRLWRRTRKEGHWWAWLEPVVCPVCGHLFDPTAVATRDIVWSGGPPRWCAACSAMLRGRWTAHSDPETQRVDLLGAIRHLTEVLGHPPRSNWQQRPVPWGSNDQQRDRLLLARAAMPSQELLDQLQPRQRWTVWLREAGVVGDRIPTPRGVRCTARDGHECGSLLEEAIDDYLFDNGIEHEREPAWPWHPQWNPTGRRRADWRLSDGTYVEAAGAPGIEEYEAKMEEKRLLAAALGIPLVIIWPKDVPALADLLPVNDVSLS